ncbi:MAG: hypothetical protein WA478_21940, partial [Pseudolabrys sp.]
LKIQHAYKVHPKSVSTTKSAAYPHTTIAIPPTAYRGALTQVVTSAAMRWFPRSDLGGENITCGTAQDSRASVTRLTQALNE